MNEMDTLVRMVNQISINNRHHGEDALAAEAVAMHLKKFWARRMKQQIIDYAENDGGALEPVSLLAVVRLRNMSDEVRDWSDTSDAG
ncbi:formate dehydrogenase subunit delta [Larsenimonas rhizosphaerae]|uniref:Formate dehydrogenase subunit delta n=1 Tax=Larsenimonas rhizosphaerae TaxID=2944682 RepID=A0AA41ZP34_9GAMM|nr:formate dehydrogenase subunit delta [Larsenimonas rhizosphaerae]MCX2525508.1 formate dehydrogenase subunit delta [Larsenimonas rhizosphaerae]